MITIYYGVSYLVFLIFLTSSCYSIQLNTSIHWYISTNLTNSVIAQKILYMYIKRNHVKYNTMEIVY